MIRKVWARCRVAADVIVNTVPDHADADSADDDDDDDEGGHKADVCDVFAGLRRTRIIPMLRMILSSSSQAAVAVAVHSSRQGSRQMWKWQKWKGSPSLS